MENLSGEGREAPARSRATASPRVHKAECQPGQVWVPSAATSLPGLHLPVVGAGPNGSHPLCCNCLGSPLHHLMAVLVRTPNASHIHVSRTQPL